MISLGQNIFYNLKILYLLQVADPPNCAFTSECTSNCIKQFKCSLNDAGEYAPIIAMVSGIFAMFLQIIVIIWVFRYYKFMIRQTRIMNGGRGG